MRLLIPTTDATHELAMKIAEGRQAEIEKDGFDRLVPQCDLCLVKSGTSTLHVAAFDVPMIVVYRASPILWHGLARWLVKVKKLALVNILAGNTDLVPEFIPWYGAIDAVVNCALEMLRNPEKLVEQRERLRKLISTLDRPGASMNAARMALEMMDQR